MKQFVVILFLIGENPSKQRSLEKTSMLTPVSFELFHNYPLPFNPSTTISYALPQDGHVSRMIDDALGREVTMLMNEFKQTGRFTETFDASRLSSGVYYYKLISGKYSSTKKMMLVK